MDMSFCLRITLIYSCMLAVFSVAALRAEEFLKSNRSALEQRAAWLATMYFQQETAQSGAVLNSGEIAGIVIAVIVVILTLASVLAVIGGFVNRFRLKR